MTDGWDGGLEGDFSWIRLQREAAASRAERSPDLGIFDHLEMRVLASDLARPYHLSEQYGYDTVVLEQACDRQPNELPPGDYKVVVKAGTRDIVASRVTIGLAQSVTLEIAMKDGQLVIGQ